MTSLLTKLTIEGSAYNVNEEKTNALQTNYPRVENLWNVHRSRYLMQNNAFVRTLEQASRLFVKAQLIC